MVSTDFANRAYSALWNLSSSEQEMVAAHYTEDFDDVVEALESTGFKRWLANEARSFNVQPSSATQSSHIVQ